ncbi:MAG: tetraacyldisaccharide 4'-kinase [Luteibaculaceae bacterium]
MASILRAIRILLFPISILYGLIVRVRHFLFEVGVLKSVQPRIKTLCVGNLSMGGTGKSPMMEFLIRNLQHEFNLATLSRGYGRKTKGFLPVLEPNPSKFGDEPSVFKQKFPELPVFVGEDRVKAVQSIEKDVNLNCILLDDAFQHRALKAHVNLVITDYNKPFYRDFFFPTGNLRDSVSALKRADILVFSKCPESLSEQEKQTIRTRVKSYGNPEMAVFFSGITYGHLYPIHAPTQELAYPEKALCVTGIANPKPLLSFLESRLNQTSALSFPDHYVFTAADAATIEQKARALGDNPTLITTEKDAVRLLSIVPHFKAPLSILVQPIQIHFFGDEDVFLNQIRRFLTC